MTQPTAKYFLDALYEYAAEKIAEEQVRINVGTVSIYPMIDGSFDSEDAEFVPEPLKPRQTPYSLARRGVCPHCVQTRQAANLSAR